MAHLDVVVSLASVSSSRRARIAARNIGLFVLSATFLIAAASAQTDPAGGILPFSTHVGGQYDSIDLASSNVTLNIPVRSKAGKIPFTFSLVANSHFSISRCAGKPVLVQSDGGRRHARGLTFLRIRS